MSASGHQPGTARERSRGAQWRLLLAAALAISCGVLGAGIEQSVLRAAAALILELVLPGYALAVFATRRRELGVAGLALCALGASLVVAAIGGLLLDLLPGHTGRVEWAVFLTLVTLVALGAAARWPLAEQAGSACGLDLKRRGDQPERFYRRWGRRLETSARVIVNVALGMIALGLAIAGIAIAGHAATRAPGYAELSALPLSSAERSALRVTVKSHEHHRAIFAVTVRENGRLISSTQVELQPLQSWQLITRRLRSSTRRVRVDMKPEGSPGPDLHTLYYARASANRLAHSGAR